jgi:hypothetical protein
MAQPLSQCSAGLLSCADVMAWRDIFLDRCAYGYRGYRSQEGRSV